MRTIKLAFYIAKYGHLSDILISWCTWGKYSHVELLFEDGRSFSSSPRKGISGTSWQTIDFKPDRWDFIEYTVSEEQYETLIDFANQEVGKPYDWLGTLSFILPVKQQSNKWFCSEVIIAAFQRIGIFSHLRRSKVNPSQFYKFGSRKPHPLADE